MIWFISTYNLDEASCEPFNLNEDGTEVAGSLIHNYFKKMKCTYVVGGLIKVYNFKTQSVLYKFILIIIFIKGKWIF